MEILETKERKMNKIKREERENLHTFSDTTPNNHEMALRFASFRHIKTIWFGLKNGRDESAPTPCGVHVAIYLRKKWILRCVR